MTTAMFRLLGRDYLDSIEVEIRTAEEMPAATAAAAQPAEQAAVSEELPAAGEAEKIEEAASSPADTVMTEKTLTADQPGKECPVCGRLLLLKSDRFGSFWSCSGYPACRHTEAYEAGQEKMDLLCPLCRKESLVVKPTPGGKELYVCPGAGCEFMAWSRPHALPCPSCGSPFLVEKKTVAGRLVLRCPRAGCSYYQPLAGAVGGDIGEQEAAAGTKKVLVRRAAGGGKTRKVLVRRKGR